MRSHLLSPFELGIMWELARKPKDRGEPEHFRHREVAKQEIVLGHKRNRALEGVPAWHSVAQHLAGHRRVEIVTTRKHVQKTRFARALIK